IASGGVRNSSNITFWSESRISVNKRLRNERKRTSNAASADANPTFRIMAKSRSFPEKNGSISLASRRMISTSYVSQSRQRCKEKRRLLGRVEKIVGGIRHAHFLAGVRSVATGCWSFAAFRVQAL